MTMVPSNILTVLWPGAMLTDALAVMSQVCLV